MRNVVGPATGAPTGVAITNVSSDEIEVFPSRRPDLFFYFIEILFLARGKVVQTDNLLSELEQGFDYVRADESGGARDEPGFWPPLQID